MKKFITHPAAYVGLYILFMIPTYVLPFLGSNSSMIHAAAAASDTVNLAFYVHLAVLLVLVALAWYRGDVIGRRWLVVFPILALCFDLVPFINFIPFVATAMHLTAIITGVVVSNQPAPLVAGDLNRQ